MGYVDLVKDENRITVTVMPCSTFPTTYPHKVAHIALHAASLKTDIDS
jgi:hypothetical protein